MHPNITPIATTRQCRACNTAKPLSAFYLNRGAPSGACIECYKQRARDRRVGVFVPSLHSWKRPTEDGKWICSRCKIAKPVADYPSDASKPRGHSYTCRPCRRAYQINKRLNNPQKRYGHGITPEEYDALNAAQQGLCAICGQPNMPMPTKKGDTGRLFIDHCHTLGHVRGLLCLTCNTGLGMFRDDTDLLAKAITYLTARSMPNPA